MCTSNTPHPPIGRGRAKERRWPAHAACGDSLCPSCDNLLSRAASSKHPAGRKLPTVPTAPAAWSGRACTPLAALQVGALRSRPGMQRSTARFGLRFQLSCCRRRCRAATAAAHDTAALLPPSLPYAAHAACRRAPPLADCPAACCGRWQARCTPAFRRCASPWSPHSSCWCAPPCCTSRCARACARWRCRKWSRWVLAGWMWQALAD